MTGMGAHVLYRVVLEAEVFLNGNMRKGGLGSLEL